MKKNPNHAGPVLASRPFLIQGRTTTLILLLLYIVLGNCSSPANQMEVNLVDYFMPMEPQGPLVSEGIFGVPAVFPRDPLNGLEDSDVDQWVYWDGRIVKGHDGKYHMYASRWDQKYPHGQGWKEASKAIHAVSDDVMGPYEDTGLAWPHWQEGKGHNVIGLRMHDGRYAMVCSGITYGEIFVSDNPDGPWELLGQIKVDENGFDRGLAILSGGGRERLSNVSLILRPDGRYMIIPRSTCTMISDSGILGPYKIMHDRVYRKYPDLPQTKNEDPTIWFSGGMYHIVYNHWPSKTAYHFTSQDGILDWTYRGVAFRKDALPFRYTDGTTNDWAFIERPMAYVENGHVTHFTFSVIDVKKGQDRGNDNHGSKIIVVPFDGKAFDRDMKKLVRKEKPSVERDKPNLVWIITDEHNFRTLGCYREQLSQDQAFLWGKDALVETPNIDMLAEFGTLFDRMYASAPVCTPSRASMFTGQYPHLLGMPNNSSKVGDGKYLKPEVRTIAEVLLEHGYSTGYGGKWHLAEKTDPDEFWSPYPLGHPGHNYGFTDNRYMFNGGHDKYKGIDTDGNPYRASKNPEKIGADDAGQPVYRDERSENVKFTTDWLTDRTIEFIDANKKKPFFYVSSIPDPHTPNVVRSPYDTMYNDMDIRLPRTFYNNNEGNGSDEWRLHAKTDDTLKLIHDIRQYFGMVKNIDDNVGRIIRKLEDEGILENTIILFSSDHGDLLGEHGRVNKGTIHEASAKIPFVMMHGKNLKDPLIPRGKVVREAGNTTDWMPTFLGLLGIPCPEAGGRDLTPLLADEVPDDWNDVTFICKGWMAAVTSRYKLFLSSNWEPWLLDIVADPDENINFINHPDYGSIAEKLASDLKEYMAEQNDPNEKISVGLERIIYRSKTSE